MARKWKWGGPSGRPKLGWPRELNVRAIVEAAIRDQGLSIRWTSVGSTADEPTRVDYRYAGQEYLKWYREDCRRNGRKYVRAEAIEKAVKLFKLDRRKFINWLDRSKRAGRRP
jgi:hypothetical protein